MRLFEGTEFDIPPRCDRCNLLETDCTCPPSPKKYLPANQQRVKLRVERRKHGKTVTIVGGLSPDESDLPELLRLLKSVCGTGGTIRDDLIELQGNQGERAATRLAQMGYKIAK